jgi:hypothetical protein
LKQSLQSIEEEKIKTSKVEMIPFDVKNQNTHEKGGKKVEKKKTILDDEEDEYHTMHNHFGQGQGAGRGRRYVQCSNQ